MADINHGPVRCQIAGGIATLTLDNPPLNVVFRGLTEALGHSLAALQDDATVRVVVVTGAGERAFCAGSDIVEFQPLMQPGRIGPEKLALQHAVFGQLADFPKPTIAAVNGLAFGGGLEIAVCCDFIVADEKARFALPEIKLGVFPGSGGPVRVARRIGSARAKEMMLLGDPIDAANALAWGLVNQVVPAGQSLSSSVTLAEKLLQRPSLAMALCKQAIAYAFDFPERDAIAKALPLSERAFTSSEAHEGVRAFLEKQTPQFPNALHDKD